MHYQSIFRPQLFDECAVIVTGGGSGIGRCIAHELGALGATVVITGRRIEKLEDAIAAFAENKREQHIIRFISGSVECIDKVSAETAHESILNTYGIPTDRRL